MVLLAMLAVSGDVAAESATVRSVCELSKDFPGYRGKVVTVRGVYYYGLRQQCAGKCAVGLWPSFINLEGGTDNAWAAIAKVERDVEAEAKRTGKRFEIWVTVVGSFQTRARTSPVGPCDWKSSRFPGYGHLGAFPAQIIVKMFRDIEVRENPQSPYDYANMYHGAL